MDISQAIYQTIYPKEQLSTIMMFFMKNYSHREHSTLYLHTNRDNEKIFIGRHNIPVIYSHNNYRVDILVYYPKNFLFSGPEFYFENKPNLGISNEYADVSVDMKTLKINIEFFLPWNKNTKNLEEIISFLKMSFDETFPCYNQTNNSQVFSGLCNFSTNHAIKINIDKKENPIKTNCYGVPMSVSNPINNNNPNISNTYNNNNLNSFNNNNKSNNNYSYNQNYNNNLYNKVGTNPPSYNTNNNFQVTNNYGSKISSFFVENNLNEIIRREILWKIKNEKILETQINDIIGTKNRIKYQNDNIKKSNEENIKNVQHMKNNISSILELLTKLESLETSLTKDVENLKYKNSIPISLNNINEYVSNYNLNKLKYLSYELTLHEYIASFKKLLEKGIINFQDALFKIRRYSREIFTIKVMEFKANNY